MTIGLHFFSPMIVFFFWINIGSLHRVKMSTCIMCFELLLTWRIPIKHRNGYDNCCCWNTLFASDLSRRDIVRLIILILWVFQECNKENVGLKIKKKVFQKEISRYELLPQADSTGTGPTVLMGLNLSVDPLTLTGRRSMMK